MTECATTITLSILGIFYRPQTTSFEICLRWSKRYVQDPGSSYIWLSGKVTSNLSQIPNNFCLFLPEILNSGQIVSHDFQKRKFHVINHLSERSERTVIST